MATFLKIAWRNVLRNHARSAITITAISIGLCALIFLKAFVDGADYQMISNYTDLFVGHLQVHKAGFQKNMGLDKSINNEESVVSALRKIPEVQAFAPRVKDFALISSSEGSAGILLLGIDPARESRVTSLNKKIRDGQTLQDQDKDGILMGRQLAENLGVGVGDKVVLMSQAFDGSIAASAFDVTGLLEAGAEEIDKNLAIITLKAAQEFFAMEKRVSEIAIKLRDLKGSDETAAVLRRSLGRDFEVLTWKEISPMTYQWLQFDQVFTSLILTVVLFIVAAGILNTVLMGVLERTKEFGIMLALGTKPDQIVLVIALESIILGIAGALAGTVLGVALVIFFNHVGIDLSSISQALNSFYIGSVIYPVLSTFSVIFYAVCVILISVAVSVFPARKASRLSPIEAIRS